MAAENDMSVDETKVSTETEDAQSLSDIFNIEGNDKNDKSIIFYKTL